MKQDRQPLGQPVDVAGGYGYQLYARVYNGTLRFSARVGKLWINRQTNEPAVIPEFDLYSAEHFRKSVTAAKKHLGEVKAEVFAEQVSRAGASQFAADGANVTAGASAQPASSRWSK